ncbi:MFS transporter [Methanocella sp. CWC-04]|uniref:MFS transporter n=2 Tax=Methanooceanicella nereidis TaxID=2052831 RepID=A0AAP2W852_9EURY|nr:MFS transporter [Methanocella sp. CWC-04]
MGLRLPSFDRRVWILFLGTALNQFGMSIVMPFISIYLYVYQGIPASYVGLAMFTASFVGAMFQFIGGEMCDRLGRRFVLIAGLVTLIISFLLLGWAVSVKAPYAYYLVFLSMTRMATGLFRPIPNIIAADIVPSEKRLEVFGILRIALNIGFATGPVVGGLMAIISYSSMFYLTAVTSTIYLLLVIFFIGDTRTCKPAGKFSLRDLKSIKSDRPFMIFSVMLFLVAIVYSQMYTPLSMYAKDFVGLSEPEIGMLFAVNGLMVVFMQYPVTLIADRYRLTVSMGIGALLYGLGFGIVSISSGFWMLAACIFVVTLGELFFSPSSTNLTANLSAGDKRGRYLGFSGLANSMGFAVGPLLGGVLLDVFAGSQEYTWMIIGAAGALCTLGFLSLKKLVPPEKNDAEYFG